MLLFWPRLCQYGIDNKKPKIIKFNSVKNIVIFLLCVKNLDYYIYNKYIENIINKLKSQPDYSSEPWKNWSLEEKRKLLELYLIISKKEENIYKLIYSYQDTDCFEDIFRDYDYKDLQEKAEGVEIAVNNIIQEIKRNKKCIT